MILLAAAVVTFAVSLGTALTLDRRSPATAAAVAVQPAATTLAVVKPARPLPEAGALMLTGWLLIGLAAAVRRTS
jgi:hypothetical protein